MTDPVSNPVVIQSRWDTTDSALVGAVAVVGALIRFWMLDQASLDHLDEGAYAISSLAVANGEVPSGLYPFQYFLSPPMFFSASGLLMRLLGTTSGLVPLTLSATFGVATIVLIYAIARHWFDRAAAIGAAILLALSNFHILYSRSGLTDVMFTFFLLAAIWLFGLAESRNSPRFSILAGVAAGFAWNTKYHGWLVLVIAAAALLPLLLSGERPLAGGRKKFVSAATRLCVAAGIAVLMYIPWLTYVSAQEGGYARLVGEHASFLRPLEFFRSAIAQAQFQGYFDGWLSRAALSVAMAAVLFLGGYWRHHRFKTGLWIIVSAVVGLGFGGPAAVTVLALIGCRKMLKQNSPEGWLLLAYFLTFSILTPLYHPYSRLLLPWACGSFLLAGAGLKAMLDRCFADARGFDNWRREIGVATLLVVAGAAAFWLRGQPASGSFRAHEGLREAAVKIAETLPRSAQVAVLGEPGLVFYLKRLGYAARFEMPGRLDKHFEPGDQFHLVAGIYSRRANAWSRWMERHPGAAREVGTVSADVNDIRLLDDFRPRQAREYRRGPRDDYRLQVYLVRMPEP
jgi:4-amino-4-deoxy-L-arabinose transferase-like glycosyltransferase